MCRFSTTSVKLNNHYTAMFKVIKSRTTEIIPAKVEALDLFAYPVEGFDELRRDKVIAVEKGGAERVISYWDELYRFAFFQNPLKLIAECRLKCLPLKLCSVFLKDQLPQGTFSITSHMQEFFHRY